MLPHDGHQRKGWPSNACYGGTHDLSGRLHNTSGLIDTRMFVGGRLRQRVDSYSFMTAPSTSHEQVSRRQIDALIIDIR
jgi:hypothetical protein